ncbi:2,3-diphosphoglycerate synthetase [Candidatus Gracilibacteria bacterium]|nr:2,3-diphosphoglycerate synthetase [Candidatus Gracilibacteria bacterium]
MVQNKSLPLPITACLVDGEHYLPNLKASLAQIAKRYQIKYLIFIGGTEKIGTPQDVQKALPYTVYFANHANKPDVKRLDQILTFHPVKIVLDLSDEPIMDYMTRFEIASYILYHGAIYKGSDFQFDPLRFKKILSKKSLAIWGTGKRIGKTAIGGFIGRTLREAKRQPAIITLSRGGPDNPLVVRGDKLHINVDYLLGIDAQGMHASSDCFEDALTAKVITFGCRRCGGGMSGKAMITVLDRGVRMAEVSREVKTVIIEGSGATVPEIKTDKVILVMDATQPLEILEGYLTPLRILYADLIIVNMCEDFLVSERKLKSILHRIREINPNVRIATTVLRPKPLAPIKGKRVFLTTTAPEKALPFLEKYLEKTYACHITGISNNLSVRPLLIKDLKKIKKGDIVATELKAAAIAVVAKESRKLGLSTVLMDNIPLVVDRGGNVKNLKKEILKLV